MVAPEAISTCEPSTSKSGSAMLIKKPKRKLREAILNSELEVAISLDICPPIGFIARSTPHKKIDNPIRRITLHIIKRIITSVSACTIVKQSTITKSTTGSRVRVTSLPFSKSSYITSPLILFRLRCIF